MTKNYCVECGKKLESHDLYICGECSQKRQNVRAKEDKDLKSR